MTDQELIEKAEEVVQHLIEMKELKVDLVFDFEALPYEYRRKILIAAGIISEHKYGYELFYSEDFNQIKVEKILMN